MVSQHSPRPLRSSSSRDISRNRVQQPLIKADTHQQITISRANRNSKGNSELRRPSPGLQSGPLLKSPEPWQTWPELTVRVYNFPLNVTTWDLWQRFQRESNVTFIELFENRQGLKDGCGRVRFQPPPRVPFWTNVVRISTPDGECQIKVVPEPRRRLFQIQSPIRKSVWYPELMTLDASELDFGIMFDEAEMMKMYTASSSVQNGTSFKLDLYRKRIIASFHVPFKGDNNEDIGTDDRIRRYRFTINFEQLAKIQRVDINERQWALIMSLDCPPQFFRQSDNLAASHIRDSLQWSEFDSWFRTTDIVHDSALLKTAVVSLNKENPIIDIGRWTTYRFVFEKDRCEPMLVEKMANALQDFNIEIVDLKSFNIIPRKPASIWSLVDPPKADQAATELTSLSFSESDHRNSNLPFEIRYQLEVCLSQGFINEQNITPEFLQTLAKFTVRDQAKARSILEYIAEQEKRIYNPMAVFEDREALGYSPKSKIPHYCAYSRKATVTPTTIYYSSPSVETTNRVIRNYSAFGDRFLRVQFTDEKCEGRINSRINKTRDDDIFRRVLWTLSNGIQIGDRHYEFLAFGNSQFRENGAYFFCATEQLTCNDIRQWMGDFNHISVVARYAARLGLCFSTTRAINSTGVQIIIINDVKRNDYCFTDGVGKISGFLSSMIANELNLPSDIPPPSAFQFRLGGCKGMLALSPDARGREVHIRQSQQKFTARYNGLEIIRCSRYSMATLNRQTITILSALGVPDSVFNRMLIEQLSNYHAALSNPTLALNLLGRYIDDNHMTIKIASMVINGFMDEQEPFVISLMHLWRSWSIKLLKEKAKIIVEDGAFLLGVTDETGKLRGHKSKNLSAGSLVEVDQLPQIFLQVPEKGKPGKYIVIQGTCIVGRNPSLHPGDIRIVQAIDLPELHNLRDVVVFPQQGDRDIPSMCSGGDLDGDDFFVIWDKDLSPKEWNAEPMAYSAPDPRQKDGPVEIEDLMKFFVRYMKNDALPTIAHAHLANADYLDKGVKDPRCLSLAELHSKAVDYVKTGIPANCPKTLMPRKWPHFMEKKYKSKEQIYNSDKILGQLYDKVESVAFSPQYELPFSRRILAAYNNGEDIPEAAMKASRQIKTKYDTAMRRIMAQHEIKTEFEIWSTFVLSRPRVGSDYKMQEEMAIITGALKDRFRQICIEHAGSKDFKDLGPFVAAMYRVTKEEMDYALYECHTMKIVGGREVPKRIMEPRSMPLISFPWLFHKTLGRIATGNLAAYENDDLPPILQTNRGDERPSFVTVGRDQPHAEDFVQTADGAVTHRGEILDLFAPNDVDSEGEYVEQPYAAPARQRPGLRSLHVSGIGGDMNSEAEESDFSIALEKWTAPPTAKDKSLLPQLNHGKYAAGIKGVHQDSPGDATVLGASNGITNSARPASPENNDAESVNFTPSTIQPLPLTLRDSISQSDYQTTPTLQNDSSYSTSHETGKAIADGMDPFESLQEDDAEISGLTTSQTIQNDETMPQNVDELEFTANEISKEQTAPDTDQLSDSVEEEIGSADSEETPFEKLAKMIDSGSLDN